MKNVYACKPQFSYIRVGCKRGVRTSGAINRTGEAWPSMLISCPMDHCGKCTLNELKRSITSF